MEEFDFYPNKPELVEPTSKGTASKTIFSIVLFVLSMLFVFSDQFNFIFYLVIVLLVHEGGHYSMMKLFRYENVRLLFVPLMGAFVQGKKDEYKQKESVFVVMAGPVPGIVIGCLLVYFGIEKEFYALTKMGFLFLFLNLINLLPIDPLDGGHIVRILVRSGQELFLLIFSFISSLLLIGIGLFLKEWIIVVFGFLMGFRVRTIQKNYHIHKELKQENVNYTTSYKQLTNRDFSKIKQILMEYSPSLRMYMEQMSSEETDPVIAGQVNNVLVAPLQKDAGILFKVLVVLIWIMSFVVPFIMLTNLDFSGFMDYKGLKL